MMRSVIRVVLGFAIHAQIEGQDLGALAEQKLRELMLSIQPAGDNRIAEITYQITCAGISATAFVLNHQPADRSRKPVAYLVSAKHFFDDCKSAGRDVAKVRIRYSDPDDPNVVSIKEHSIKIVTNNRPLWKQPSDGDAGVIRIEVPDGAIRKPVSSEVLADTNLLRNLLLGTVVFQQGFPFASGVPGLTGYSLIHAGHVAQPFIDGQRDIAIAFDVFPGDSGGPVYFSIRRGDSVQVYIIGILVRTALSEVKVREGNKDVIWKIQQGIGYITPATKIIEILALFDAEPSDKG